MNAINRMIDISAVKTEVTRTQIDEMIEVAKRYQLICVFAMPAFTPYVVNKLKEESAIHIGGVVGFPSGQETTEMKVQQSKMLLDMGVNELDMVINVGALKSKMYQEVFEDIRSVVTVREDIPVKAIIESAYLSDYEIAKASEIAVKAGVKFVKTGTGWANKPTTVETIKLIKDTIGDAAEIKAAGGVRDLETILEMIDAGCTRFGVGTQSVMHIMEQIEHRKICR